jgi:hypothetical protein
MEYVISWESLSSFMIQEKVKIFLQRTSPVVYLIDSHVFEKEGKPATKAANRSMLQHQVHAEGSLSLYPPTACDVCWHGGDPPHPHSQYVLTVGLSPSSRTVRIKRSSVVGCGISLCIQERCGEPLCTKKCSK